LEAEELLDIADDGVEEIMAWCRVVLQCHGVPSGLGEKGAEDITANFSKRSWHRNAVCSWDGATLTLSVENDFDRQGRATMDEFSDEISACIPGSFDGDLRVVSVTKIS
jgi:hypothetical protein